VAFKKREKKAFESFHFEERGGPTVFADGMRHLTQEIANSFDTRVAGVATLKQDLRRFLGNAESSRLRHFRALHESIRAGQEARSQHLSGLLAGFRRITFGFRQDHQAAAGHWRSMAAALAKKRDSLAR
jgi:hypothetical protein